MEGIVLFCECLLLSDCHLSFIFYILYFYIFILQLSLTKHISSLSQVYQCLLYSTPFLLNGSTYLPKRIAHNTHTCLLHSLPNDFNKHSAKRKGHAKSSGLVRRNRTVDVVNISESLQKRNATSGGEAYVASSERKLVLATNTQRQARTSLAKRTGWNRKHHVNRIHGSHGKIIKSKRANTIVVDVTAKGNRKAGLDVITDLELPHTLHETLKTLTMGFNTL